MVEEGKKPVSSTLHETGQYVGGFPQPSSASPFLSDYPVPGDYPPPYQATDVPGYSIPTAPIMSIQQPGYSDSIVQQPIIRSAPASGCPPGLECLTHLNSLVIKQKVEDVEVVTHHETQNRYECYNSLGHPVFQCREKSNYCARQCCRSQRAFKMHITGSSNSEVIRIRRPYRCVCFCQCCSCCGCCVDEVQVESPVGDVIGYVREVRCGCRIGYEILDRNNDLILKIRGPLCFHCACIGEDIVFKITSKDGKTELGRIINEWSNIPQKMFTSADNFSLTFPIDLDVRIKAILLSAVFLIDFMYFEKHPRKLRRH